MIQELHAMILATIMEGTSACEQAPDQAARSRLCVNDMRIQVRDVRLRAGWTQAELADRTGLSRAGISAIESGRLVPSTAAALAIAAVFGCRVEDLFSIDDESTAPVRQLTWAWSPFAGDQRYWVGRVGDRDLAYPAGAGTISLVEHDASAYECVPRIPQEVDPSRTLVLASCDPAAQLFAAQYQAATPFRMLLVRRSSSAALDLLGRRLVHVAGVHLARTRERSGNLSRIQKVITEPVQLLRVADWEEGLALGTRVVDRAVSSVVHSKLTWVSREVGSGARSYQDELLTGRRPPRRNARDHQAVAEAIRSGWADVGVCHRMACAESGLRFLPLGREIYDLCFLRRDAEDPRVRALIEVVRGRKYRSLLHELPGFDPRKIGEIESSHTTGQACV
jgi:molybdate-binding protein/DNA-binding XRE family transcriptional regulator